MKTGWKISAYLVRAVLPYFLMSWLILTVILFVQQAGRYSEIFFSPNLPSSFAWQIAIALIPNVIAFTCPMAVLVGVIVGMSRMQVDSEITAIRSFGVGNLAMLLPLVCLGIILSFISLIVNIFGVPLASRVVRDTAMRSAVYKLESPIEPGVFNTEVSGLTIYVKDGDVENGHWRNVFVYSEDQAAKRLRLITSSRGRIDSNNQKSELVLQDAMVSTLSETLGAESIVSERVGELRLAIRTQRDEMIERLSVVQPSLEEVGLSELAEIARTGNERDRREASILIIRKIVLAIAPVVFCLLGAMMVLRLNRRGRGFGVLLALVALLMYFLLTFAGEQLARTGTVSPIVGGLFPLAMSALAASYFAITARYPGLFGWSAKRAKPEAEPESLRAAHRGRDILLDITTGIRDFDLIVSLLKYFVLAALFVAGIFIVFTAFELWRYAGSFDGGTGLLFEYIAFLTPYIYLQVASTGVLISILAVFTIKSRQNEIVAWLSTGQSIYRLILPCLLLMSFLGLINFIVQDRIATATNIRQEALRFKIRSRGVARKIDGRQWVAADNAIISFELPKAASDNGIPASSNCLAPCRLQNIALYKFGVDNGGLQSVYRVSEGTVEAGSIAVTGKGEVIEVREGKIERADIEGKSIETGLAGTLAHSRSPNQSTVGQTRDALKNASSDIEKRALTVSLEKKYVTIAIPLVIALFTLPFAIGVDRRSRVVQIAYAVGLWLIFIGTSSAFEQLGVSGALPAVIAVWSPPVFFAMIGAYLISRVRT